MGNDQSNFDDLKRRQIEHERKTEKEKKELWNKWLIAEKEQKEQKMLHEAELQRERAKIETELKRQEEAKKMKLKEGQEFLRTEHLKREKAMRKAIEEEEQMKAQILHEEKRTSEERKTKELDKLRDEVPNLKPGDSIEFPNEDTTFAKELNVGLYGTTGIGKSSFINSLKFALKGELTELTMEQTSTDNFHGGNTVRRLPVRITKYLTFIDNRGVGAEDLETIDASNEIISQLEGRSSFAEKVEWRKESSSKKTLVNEEKQIHCTVLVFDAQNPQSVYTVLSKLVTEIFEWQGRYPIGVITHVDVATPDQLENMYVVLNSAGLVDTYEVANITRERKELSLDHQLNMLKLMKRCIKEGDRIFALRGRIERMEVQQAEEREREAEEVRLTQARFERERVEAQQAKEEEDARIAKEKKEALQKKIDAEVELVLQEKFEKDRLAREAREAIEAREAREAKKNKIFVSLAALVVLLVSIWWAVE
ncbi:uncharacterized protein LOC105447171 [Strongylocentrotus purpuratus]|uniref:G domain-containing protein n=1 Tax=Strongylocentrotus purpuratus TaxID=7668 RepID=A0A7M7HMY6_STRPU|nr:uncharacterized protein LOC105447171 [Strongylocentrotus purpuratus]|eukprot:XP_011683226.1 PREDICTED: uncharacterized protein LOC105447171 [Strongylocentrotus purpuratus]